MTAEERMRHHQSLVQECEEYCERLTDWELEFVDSISDRLGKGLPLTGKQASVLEELYAKIGGL